MHALGPFFVLKHLFMMFHIFLLKFTTVQKSASYDLSTVSELRRLKKENKKMNKLKLGFSKCIVYHHRYFRLRNRDWKQIIRVLEQK